MRTTTSSLTRSASLALLVACSSSLAACGGGGASSGPLPQDGGGAPAPTTSAAAPSGGASAPGPASSPGSGSGGGSGSGSGSGGGSGSGSGGSGGSPTGGGSAAPGASASPGAASPAPGPSAKPASSPTPSPTPPAVSTLSLSPASGIAANVGQNAQVGILDPGYSGPFSVSLDGGGLLSDALYSIATTTYATYGNSGTALLNLDLPGILAASVLGPKGNVLSVCETAGARQCASLPISTVPGLQPILASLGSIVLSGPNQQQTLSLASTLSGLLGTPNFAVSSSSSDVSVTNLGNGLFTIAASANAAVPLTATITVSDLMGHLITIPVTVL